MDFFLLILVFLLIKLVEHVTNRLCVFCSKKKLNHVLFALYIDKIPYLQKHYPREHLSPRTRPVLHYKCIEILIGSVANICQHVLLKFGNHKNMS